MHVTSSLLDDALPQLMESRRCRKLYPEHGVGAKRGNVDLGDAFGIRHFGYSYFEAYFLEGLVRPVGVLGIRKQCRG